MNDITVFDPSNESNNKRGFNSAFEHCKRWSAEHQAEVGVAEMALGVAAIAWGLQAGLIHFGTDVVGTELSDGGLLGGAAGAGVGGIGGTILGSIGVAGAVTFGIPAVLLASGGSLILGAAGYGIGDVAQKLLTPPPGFGEMLAGASVTAIGIALIIDGARRVVTDERVLKKAAQFKDGVIHISSLTSKVIAKTMDEFQEIIANLSKNQSVQEAALATTTTSTAIAGTAIGGGLAAGSVTVLGSHGLGAVALSLGLVSAPVWPVVVGGAAGLAVGLAAWKGVKHYANKKNSGNVGKPPFGGLLPQPKDE